MAGVRNLMQQRALLLKRLSVAETMRTFITQQMGDSEELRAKLGQVESDLVATWKAIVDEAEALRKVEGEKEMAQAKTSRLKEKVKATKVKGMDADQEIDRLRK